MSEYDQIEKCSCGSDNTQRCVARTNIDHSSCAQPYFEPAFGCVVKSKDHKRQIMKSRGLEEIGNTPVEDMVKRENDRMKEIEKRWDSV